MDLKDHNVRTLMRQLSETLGLLQHYLKRRIDEVGTAAAPPATGGMQRTHEVSPPEPPKDPSDQLQKLTVEQPRGVREYRQKLAAMRSDVEELTIGGGNDVDAVDAVMRRLVDLVPRKTREEVFRAAKADAQAAYARHVVYQEDVAAGRWVLARTYEDGSFSSTYMTEIIPLFGGRIFVGGDVDDCVFGYGDVKHTPLQRVRWIANASPDYLREKASIGMGGPELTYEQNDEVFADDLWVYYQQLYEDASECGEDYALDLRHALVAGLYDLATGRAETHDICRDLIEADPSGDTYESVGDFGRVVARRVIVAQAACARLLELRKEKA